MNDTIINKWSMGLAVFSFGFLSIGSFLFGATVMTSILRGLGGGVLFGTSLWLTGLLVIEEKDEMEDDPGLLKREGSALDIASGGVDEDLGQESIKIDTDAVRKKFLEKSNEIEKKQSKEKEEAYKKEATPF